MEVIRKPGRRLYDIHYHLFDLSHPNLQSFLLRDDLITKDSVQKFIGKFPFILKVLPLWFLRLFAGKTSGKVKELITRRAGRMLNLLSMMEGAIEYHFLLVEYYLLNKRSGRDDHPLQGFSNMVICPLIIDFGYKGMEKPDWFYNFPPAKPVVKQVIDVLNASYFYYNYDIIIHPDKPEKFKLIPTVSNKESKFFEIYPFLGINTANYDLDEIAELFDKYFRGYENDLTPEERRSKLFRKLGTARIDIEDMIFRRKEKDETDFYSYLFAGIKLYPPLGFDPWPSHDEKELDKVRFLYSECIRKGIPVTVHCSDGGFITSVDSVTYTNPAKRWSQVLSLPEYRNLRINFAHLGNQKDGRTDWRETIMASVKPDGNVYTDCSCVTSAVNDYETIGKIMNSSNESKILFGTDFIINLIWSDSYNQYIENLLETSHLTALQKELISKRNPEKFLFG